IPAGEVRASVEVLDERHAHHCSQNTRSARKVDMTSGHAMLSGVRQGRPSWATPMTASSSRPAGKQKVNVDSPNASRSMLGPRAWATSARTSHTPAETGPCEANGGRPRRTPGAHQGQLLFRRRPIASDPPQLAAGEEIDDPGAVVKGEKEARVPAVRADH